MGILVAGCAGEVGTEAPTSAPAGSDATQTESLASFVTTTVSTVGQTAGVCAPLTCCFPTGAEWGTNDFENGLRALGCSTPQAYTERYGSTNWWMFTKCRQSLALTALVLKYANVAPYQSSYALNECLLLNQPLLSNEVFVQFDPTCSSCKSAVR